MVPESHQGPRGKGTGGGINQGPELSDSEEFASEERQLREIEVRISKAPGIEHDLRTLTVARADRETVLRVDEPGAAIAQRMENL